MQSTSSSFVHDGMEYVFFAIDFGGVVGAFKAARSLKTVLSIKGHAHTEGVLVRHHDGSHSLLVKKMSGFTDYEQDAFSGLDLMEIRAARRLAVNHLHSFDWR